MNTAIYHLHIPRTSGIFIKNILLEDYKKNNKAVLCGHNIKIKMEDFKNKDYISGHYGLTPIPHSLKTFAILRDPVERSFSYMKYIWKWFYNDKSIEDVFNFFLTDKNFRELLSNQQSKFLTQSTNLDDYNNNIDDMEKHVLSGWSLIDKQIKQESVLESISKNNIEILFFEDKNLYKKVFNIFELKDVNNINYHKKINESPMVDSKFYKKCYNEIYKINNVDIDVYNFLRRMAQ
jgi:hypothetical protein